MRTATVGLVLLCLLLVGGSAAEAWAAEGMVEETFSYGTGGSDTLEGKKEGVGWERPWLAKVSAMVAALAQPLVVEVGDGRAVRGGARALRITGPVLDDAALVARGVAQPWSADTIYVRVLVRHDQGTVDDGHAGDFVALWLDAAAEGDHKDAPQVGFKSTPGDPSFFVGLGGQREFAGAPLVQGEAYLLVMKVSKSRPGMEQPYDRVALWVNPRGATEPAADAQVESGAGGLAALRAVGLRVVSVEADDQVLLDELRVAGTWAEVMSASEQAERAAPPPPPHQAVKPRPVTIEERAATTTLRVGPDQALTTLGAALAEAAGVLQKGEGVRIVLQPGRYREGDLVLDATKWEPAGRDAVLVIEAAEPGKTVITGAEDRSTGWEQVRPGVYRNAWPYEWGNTYSGAMGAKRDGLRVAIEAGTSQVALRWQAVEGAARYRVLRPGANQTLYEGEQTSFTETNLPNNGWFTHHTFHYVVQALDGAGRVLHTSATLWATPIGPGYQFSDYVELIGRRRDMLLFNGRMLRQVLAEPDLAPGTFLVDDGDPADPTDGYVLMMPPQGVAPAGAQIEAGARQNLLSIKGKNNLVLRGLVFSHGVGNRGYNGGPLIRGGGGVEVVGAGGPTNQLAANILIERCRIEWNNGTGLTVNHLDGLTVRDTSLSDNGTGGAVGNVFRNIWLEDVHADRNNWRGDWAGFHGHSIAGIKLLFAHGVVARRLTANDNHAAGLWFDFNNRDLTLEHCQFNRNRTGLYYEASQGPCVVTDSQMLDNLEYGINMAESELLHLERTLVAGNGQVQLFLGGGVEVRRVLDWQTGDRNVMSCSRVTLNHCALIGLHDRAFPVKTDMDATRIARFFATYRGDHNHFYLHEAPDVILGSAREGKRYPFTEWQAAGGQDAQSVWGPWQPPPGIEVNGAAPTTAAAPPPAPNAPAPAQ